MLYLEKAPKQGVTGLERDHPGDERAGGDAAIPKDFFPQFSPGFHKIQQPLHYNVYISVSICSTPVFNKNYQGTYY